MCEFDRPPDFSINSIVVVFVPVLWQVISTVIQVDTIIRWWVVWRASKTCTFCKNIQLRINQLFANYPFKLRKRLVFCTQFKCLICKRSILNSRIRCKTYKITVTSSSFLVIGLFYRTWSTLSTEFIKTFYATMTARHSRYVRFNDSFPVHRCSGVRPWTQKISFESRWLWIA